MKNEKKTMWVFFLHKYGKFWSVWGVKNLSANLSFLKCGLSILFMLNVRVNYVLFSIMIMSSNLSRKNTNVYLPIDKCSSTESDIPPTNLFVSIILVSYISYILNYEQNVRNSNNYLALSPSFPHGKFSLESQNFSLSN